VIAIVSTSIAAQRERVYNLQLQLQLLQPAGTAVPPGQALRPSPRPRKRSPRGCRTVPGLSSTGSSGGAIPPDNRTPPSSRPAPGIAPPRRHTWHRRRRCRRFAGAHRAPTTDPPTRWPRRGAPTCWRAPSIPLACGTPRIRWACCRPTLAFPARHACCRAHGSG
jgi:hypothetical protein